MTPEQITSHVNLIMDKITGAYTAVQNLQYACQSAAYNDPAMNVVLTDIQHDLSLPKLLSDLGGLFDIIERARDNLLPEHLARLRGGPVYTTTYVHPPIPIRTSDWCACVEGDEEDGPYGWGATEDEAIEDLKEKLAEMEA